MSLLLIPLKYADQVPKKCVHWAAKYVNDKICKKTKKNNNNNNKKKRKTKNNHTICSIICPSQMVYHQMFSIKCAA